MTMRKLRLYLDTSVISCIHAPHRPKVEEVTGEFYKHVKEHAAEYELVISPVTQYEVRNCPEPKRSLLYQLLAELDLTVLSDNDEAVRLAGQYIESGVLEARHHRDLTHIAYAVIARCDYIVSWNMKHFVNTRTISGVQSVNLANHYWSPFIITPTVILGDKTDAEI